MDFIPFLTSAIRCEIVLILLRFLIAKRIFRLRWQHPQCTNFVAMALPPKGDPAQLAIHEWRT
jgi:hypothetical protein